MHHRILIPITALALAPFAAAEESALSKPRQCALVVLGNKPDTTDCSNPEQTPWLILDQRTFRLRKPTTQELGAETGSIRPELLWVKSSRAITDTEAGQTIAQTGSPAPGAWILIDPARPRPVLKTIVTGPDGKPQSFENGELAAVPDIPNAAWVKYTPLLELREPSPIWDRWTLGPRLASPYRFTQNKNDPADPNRVTSGTLSSGHASPSAYLEYHVTNKWAWRDDPHDGGVWLPWGKTEPVTSESGFRFMRYSPDLSIRLGSTSFTGAETDTAAQMGNGDFSAEFTIGFPLIGYFQNGDTGHHARISFGPVYSATHSTQLEDFKILRRHLFGAEGNVMFQKDNGLPVYISLRYGWCYVDNVDVINDDTLEIKTTNGGRPKYSLVSARAVEVELIYPFDADSGVSIGTRFYVGTHPNTWSAYIGYSISTEKLFQNLPKIK